MLFAPSVTVFLKMCLSTHYGVFQGLCQLRKKKTLIKLLSMPTAVLGTLSQPKVKLGSVPAVPA